MAIRLLIYRSKKPSDWIDYQDIEDLVKWTSFIPVSGPHDFNREVGWPVWSTRAWIKSYVLDLKANPLDAIEILIPREELALFVSRAVKAKAKVSLVDDPLYDILNVVV